MKNASQIVKRDEIWQCILFVICTHVTTFHSCYMQNALVFSQSDVHDFFMYNIDLVITY